MTKGEPRFLKVARAAFAGMWLFALLMGSCARTNEAISGETHFLQRCSGDCGAGLQCVSQVCTRTCKDDTGCTGLGEGTSCAALPTTPSGAGSSALICDRECTRDDDCTALGSGFSCEANRCRQRESPTQESSDAGRTTDAATAVSTTCEQGMTPFPISASDYDQSCEQDSDCIGIGEGDGCNCTVLCENAAINVADQATWRKDVERTPASILGYICHCPASGFPCCVEHRCSTDRIECESRADAGM